MQQTDHLAELKARAAGDEFTAAVIGLGYVGLPLAIRFVEAGYRVLGIDLDRAKLNALERGESYVDDVPEGKVAAAIENGRLIPTDQLERVAEAGSISICVPTPLSKFREPDLAALVSVGQRLGGCLRKAQLVVLESTTYPGTTEEMLLPLLERDDLKVGRDFFLAFSPERIDPGRTDFTVGNTPRVIGGVTPACTEAAIAVYSRAIEQIVPVSSSRCAEMVKMLENTFRSVNIGLVNEIAIMCDRLDIPVFEVIEAAASKPFGFMPFLPGPGLGGHCIPIDPLYLSWKMRTLDYRARFIELAEEVNRSMPDYVVAKVFEALNRHRKSVNGARILILGVAYKRDIDDVRESPAADVIRGLSARGAELCYHDPHVPELHVHSLDLTSVPLTDELLQGLDCAVIVTDHSKVDYRRVVSTVSVVVDARNATAGFRDLGDVITI